MEEHTEDGMLGRVGEILRLAMLAQDDYPHRIVDLEEHTEDGILGRAGEILRLAMLAQDDYPHRIVD